MSLKMNFGLKHSEISGPEKRRLEMNQSQVTDVEIILTWFISNTLSKLNRSEQVKIAVLNDNITEPEIEGYKPKGAEIEAILAEEFSKEIV